MKKKLKGFTLIELIVVIAIIGVLASILIPAMMGWVVRSRVTTDNNNASEVCTQLQILMTDMGGGLDDCVLVYDSSVSSNVVCKSGSISADAQTRVNNIASNLCDMSTAKWAAKVRNNTVVAVTFTTNNCKQVGGFPSQCNSEFNPSKGDNIEQYLTYAENIWS